MTWAGTTLLLVIATIACTSIAQLLQKQAAIALNAGENRSVVLNPSFLQSVFLLGLGMLIWLLVLRRLDVSVAYPLLSVNFIVVPLLAKWKFNEDIPPHRVWGSAIIIAGLALLFTG